MTDCTVDPATVETHTRTMSAIADTVQQAGSAASGRVGANDYGVLFAGWLVPMVNAALDRLEESVTRHSADLVEHRSEFEKNIAANRATDGNSAVALGTGER